MHSFIYSTRKEVAVLSVYEALSLVVEFSILLLTLLGFIVVLIQLNNKK